MVALDLREPYILNFIKSSWRLRRDCSSLVVALRNEFLF